jgi:hypothetical protein
MSMYFIKRKVEYNAVTTKEELNRANTRPKPKKQKRRKSKANQSKHDYLTVLATTRLLANERAKPKKSRWHNEIRCLILPQ